MDIYQTGALVAVIEARVSEGPKAYFKDRFFGGTPLFSQDQFIYFDVVDKARRLAPYVSPLVEGKVMEHRGYNTKVFSPPYLKPKSVVDPNQHMQERRPGEAISGSMSQAERHAVVVRESLEEHDDAITMREEVQAMEALRLGQVTVEGEGYPTQVVSFGRDAALTVVLAGAATWDNAGVEPLADIESWADLIFDKSGAKGSDVFLGKDSWAALVARLTDADKEILFNARRSSRSQAELGPVLPDYIKYRGSWGEYDFYTVSQKYQDADGTEVELLPADEVVIPSPSIEGRMTYAAIRDPRAGFASVRAFPKNWISEDPANEFVMTQSAPLAVPLRPNASLGATVLP